MRPARGIAGPAEAVALVADDVLVGDVYVAVLDPAWPPGSPVRWSGSPMVGTSRRMSTPGVLVGTMIIEKRRCGSLSGFVRHITMRKSEIEAFDENHL
jgi:hypothetical protein